MLLKRHLHLHPLSLSLSCRAAFVLLKNIRLFFTFCDIVDVYTHSARTVNFFHPQQATHCRARMLPLRPVQIAISPFRSRFPLSLSRPLSLSLSLSLS